MIGFDWLDPLFSESRERVEEHEAIVRELAERGPFLQVDVFGDAMGDACADSTCLASEADGDLHDPANHEPSCLWRRSRALYP